jgi:hypothetical protein
MRSLNPRGSRQRANRLAVRAVIRPAYRKVGSWRGGLHCQCMNSLRGKGHFSPKKLKGYEGWAAQQDEQPSLSEALRRLIETG